MSIHRYVRLERVPEYLVLGWIAYPTLNGTHHGFWSAHLAWLCSCNVVEPVTVSA